MVRTKNSCFSQGYGKESTTKSTENPRPIILITHFQNQNIYVSYLNYESMHESKIFSNNAELSHRYLLYWKPIQQTIGQLL